MPNVLNYAHCVDLFPSRLIIALGHSQTVNTRIMSSAPSESVWRLYWPRHMTLLTTPHDSIDHATRLYWPRHMTLLTTPHDSIPPADSPSWSGYSENGGRHCWGCIESCRIDHDVRFPSHSCSYYLYPAHNEVRFTRQLHQKHSVTFEATMPTHSDKPMTFTFVH